MRIWKRNAVIFTIVLFVCVALYLSWSYNRIEDGGDSILDVGQLKGDKVVDLGDAVLEIGDPLSVDLEGGEAETGAEPEDGYFSEARLTRQRARDSAIAILKETSVDKNADQTVREQAASEIEALARNTMAEERIESLIKAKGFVDCVAYINNEGIRIVVSPPEGGLVAADVAKIKDIVVAETSLTAKDIKIMDSKA